MVAQPLHGRVAQGGGPPRAPQHGRRTAANNPSVNVEIPYPLAQTLPSVAPKPRYLPPALIQPHPYQAGNQSPQWRQGDNTNDDLIFRDRHPWFNRGNEYAGRRSSQPDPPSDGPIRPSLRALNRTWNWQVGTGAAYADDLSRDYTWIGEQGSGWTTVNGGTPGFYRQGPGGTPVGDPNKGSGRVWGGPPHGYHTMYPPDRQQTQANQTARPQMVGARVDRLSNSRISGQTYSQWTQHQGA